MPKADWRTSGPYERLQTSDGPEFAWEFLNRNQEFHEDVKRLRRLQRSASNANSEQVSAFVSRWGLRFRPPFEFHLRRTGLDPGDAAKQALRRRQPAQRHFRGPAATSGSTYAKSGLGGAGSDRRHRTETLATARGRRGCHSNGGGGSTARRTHRCAHRSLARPGRLPASSRAAA